MSPTAARPLSHSVGPVGNRRWTTSPYRILVTSTLGLLMCGSGCQSWINRKKEDPFVKENRRFRELMADPDRPRLVGEVASALGLTTRRYDAMGLISNLPGTGGIVKPSEQRNMMLNEMRRHEVLNPETILDSPATALAKVRMFANPCDIKGDVLDGLVECSDECTATDLREGFLMPASLREYVFAGGKNRSSEDKATATGDVVTIPASVAGDATLNPLRGVVIGGVKLLESSKLGIRVDPDYRHVFVVGAMEKAINKRFFFQDANRQQKVATGKDKGFIEIETVPKYRWDPMHYMSTILSTGFGESDKQVDERIEGCRKLLVRRETARRAACELEAIGTKQAIEVLLEGLACQDTEVRFHSAYSLAYLDRPESVPVLQNLAITEPAFRPVCLIGLGVNEHDSAREALNELLQEPEAELRFGALIAIRQRNPRDPMVLGDSIGEICSFIRIPSSQPLVAVSLEQKKEVVLFGSNGTITLNQELSATPHFKLVPLGNNLIRIAKRQTNGEILQNIIANDLNALLRAMPSIEGNYNDVVHAMDQLGIGGHLSIPVAINPRPRAGRIYKRDGGDESQASEEVESMQIDASSRAPSKSKSSWIQLSSWPSLGVTKTTKSSSTDEETKDAEGNP